MPPELTAVSAPAVDWAKVELPAAWPDSASWRQPKMLRELLPRFLGRQRSRVQLPEGLPGRQDIPRYVLQEFHNLPNGNYSDRVTRGYLTGFDRMMLGEVQAGRARVAEALAGARRALDVGSGGGHLAATLRHSGIPEVWALEPSPYLLRQAARRHGGINWWQGLAEDTGLPDDSFDAVGVCFVLHEIPPHYIARFCAELRRITCPGALLAVLEPSPLQWQKGGGGCCDAMVGVAFTTVGWLVLCMNHSCPLGTKLIFRRCCRSMVSRWLSTTSAALPVSSSLVAATDPADKKNL